MKNFLFSVIFLVILILGLPALITFISGKIAPPAPAKSENTVSVLFADTGETKEVNLEEHLIGVVAAEMPASFHEEALKAQAVAARTYIINKKKSQSDEHPQAAVCTDSTHCKAWLSKESLETTHGKDWMSKYYGKISGAVHDTEGTIMLYGGEPIQAVFHSTGSGKTENAEDVWGNSIPYLVSVDSPGDTESPKFKTEKQMSRYEAEKLLSDFSGEKTTFSVGEIRRADSGLVKEIKIGAKTFSGNDVRTALSLNSANFEIQESGDTVTFTVHGSGHGVGLSQYGAEYLATHGKTYDEILKQYYTGITFDKYLGS